MTSPIERAQRWLADDPDPNDEQERRLLIERAASDPAAQAELADRFSGPLEFGTAGLRGVVAAGESRFNLAVVLRATFGFGRYLLEAIPGAAQRGVVIVHDARPK